MTERPPQLHSVVNVAAAVSGRDRWTHFPLYAGFLATGIGVALPGAILPVLLTRWKLQDEGGGNLFLLSFVGSSLGALLISGPLLRAIALGSATIALAGLGISVLPPHLAFGCMSLLGLGLGGTMTAISLSLQRRTGGGSKAMVRLNLLWALGASLCPGLAARSLKTSNPGAILYPLTLCFLLLAAWALRQQKDEVAATPQAAGGSPFQHLSLGAFSRFFGAVPASLILLVMLGTGIEAAVGGWLSTYAKRGGDQFAGVIAAPTCLWLGLLLSRSVWSVLLRVKQETILIRLSLVLMAVCSFALLGYTHGWQMFAAALGLGFGLGPIYPLLLAKTLRLHASGTIFFLAGLGSAVLPWMMGFVSTQSRSLHTGFYVPAAGCVVMVVLSLLAPANRIQPADRD